MLSDLLHPQGIESIVLELRSRRVVETTVRAGVLEHGMAELLRETGAGRLARGHARDVREASPAVGLLVEGIALRRNEAGQTSVEITYRFGPPHAPSEAYAVAVGDQYSWVNRATCASIDRLAWASSGGRRCAAHRPSTPGS